MNNNDNIYKTAKEVFFESKDPKDYVALDSNIVYLESLKSAVAKKFKFILITGEPGVGKSMLLKRAYFELKDPEIFLIEHPFFSLQEFKKDISYKLFGKKIELLEVASEAQNIFTLFLDEVQLYNDELLEYLRLLSDTQKFRFVLALHTDQESEKLQQKHFATRTYKKFHLTPPNWQELQIYIQKKLLQASLNDIARGIDAKRTKLIYRFTKGNFRQTDKLLFTLFDILDFFYTHHPSKINSQKIPIKYIEMSAMHLGLFHA